jgi:hypothetical protein
MKKTLVMLAVAIFAAVAGYSLKAGPVLSPSLMTFGANGSVTPTVGDCLEILFIGPNGITATDAGVQCTNPPSTIAALPTCNAAAQGLRGTVTNGQTTPTFLGTVSTTGAVVAPVFCNGTAWLYG